MNRPRTSFFTLNPFGLKPTTGELVDVEEVETGAACGCICPQCATPLVARKGESNVWHFAHESRGDAYEKASRECENSFYVSLKLLSRQILATATNLKLPAVTGSLVHAGKRHSSPGRSARRIEIDSVQIGVSLFEFLADAVIVARAVKDDGSSAEVPPLAVVLDYPGRDPIDLGDALADFESARSGALVVSLAEIWTHLSPLQRGFKAALRQLLLEGEEGKQWLFHPLKKKVQEELAQKVEAEFKKETEALLERIPTPRPFDAPQQPRAWSPRIHYESSPARPIVRSSLAKTGGSEYDDHWYWCPRCEIRFACMPPMPVGGRMGEIYCMTCKLGGLEDLGPVARNDRGS